MNEFIAEDVHSFVQGKVWFRVMADGAPLGVFMTDPDMNCLYSNYLATKITGLSAEQSLGHGWMQSIHPGDRERVMVESARARLRGVLFSCKHRFLHRGGRVVWASVKIGEIREESRILGYIGTLDDITEHIQVEQELREADEKWRSLAENIQNLICTIEPDGTLLWVNRLVLPGLRMSDVIGTSFYRFLAPDYVSSVKNVLDRVLRTGQPDFYETLAEGAHGPGTWWETRVVPIRTGGRVEKLMLISWDITQRKRAEDQIRLMDMIIRLISEAEDLNSALAAVLRKVCETTGWVLGQAWIARADGGVLECSPAWYASDARAQAFHKKTEDFKFEVGVGLPGRAWATRQPVWIPDVRKDDNFPRAAFACDEDIKAGVAIPVKSGSEVVAVIEFFLLEPRQEDENFIKLVSGVASQLGMVFQRKQAQELLRISYEQLRALSTHLQSVREQERSFIAREIHDELGQALTGLKMDVSWIETKIAPSSKVIQRPVLLKRLRGMAKLIDALVHSVRRISTELRPGVLDELGLVAAIDWQAQEFHKRSGIRCQIKMPEEDLPVGRETSTAMFRIFQEILTNVARHANATGLDIQLVEADNMLVLRVHDNGRGITPDQVADPKSLGLLGMRERVLLLNGTVEFKGARNKGTTVTVCVPMDAMKTA